MGVISKTGMKGGGGWTDIEGGDDGGLAVMWWA